MSLQMLSNVKVLITHSGNHSLCALQSNQQMKWISFPLRFKSTTVLWALRQKRVSYS
jgi:hypothetical protein